MTLAACCPHGATLQDVFNETRSILEPAGAVAVAGAKAYLKHYGLKVRCRPLAGCVWLPGFASCSSSTSITVEGLQALLGVRRG